MSAHNQHDEHPGRRHPHHVNMLPSTNMHDLCKNSQVRTATRMGYGLITTRSEQNAQMHQDNARNWQRGNDNKPSTRKLRPENSKTGTPCTQKTKSLFYQSCPADGHNFEEPYCLRISAHTPDHLKRDIPRSLLMSPECLEGKVCAHSGLLQSLNCGRTILSS